MTGAQTDLGAWLALSLAPGVGSVTLGRILEHFETPAAALQASASQLDGLGVPAQAVAALREPDAARIEQALEWVSGEGNHILTLADPRYPALLRDIPDPPPLIYINGDVDLLSMPQLAMVGSRNPSRTGEETAQGFARYLSRTGLTITSGLATGIDAASHQGALEGSGLTVAVVGTGLDRVYPARHRELAHAIAEKGALVSEFPLGTQPARGNFPRRNRIISGLSVGTLVVEAALKSGSLITARLAMEQGREVFAIPGSIHNPLARGCHRLIRDGAKLVETAEHVLEELAPLISLSLQQMDEVEPNKSTEVELDEEYRRLLDEVGFEATSVDTIVDRSGLTAEAVSSMLLVLELQGHVTTAPGGGYTRVK
ncbi:MAG: DNA-protecting protein DprA [Gammaproteobacteria bacterium]|nr:DNA-protecting protein DprA [Gammaproteobacteria bacterium]